MKCQYCKSICVKAGKQKSGIQKFRCKSCKKYQQENYSYQSLVPKSIHRISKQMLAKIERLHLSVRNSLKRFNRRTIGFSKSMAMSLACLKLFLWWKPKLT